MGECLLKDITYLKYLLESGIVEEHTTHIVEVEKRLLLTMHNQRIWETSEGYYATYLMVDGKRRLIRKKKRETLEDAIAEHYKKQLGIPTFEIAFEMWVRDKMEYREICQGTKDRYYNDYSRFIKDTYLSDMAICDITEDMLTELCRNAVRDYNLTAKAFGNLRTIIMGTFKYAKRNHLTDISISTFFKDLDISKKAYARPVEKAQVFTDEELVRIIQYIKEHKTVGRLGVLLALQTGMREGELSALRYSDIDGNVIHIRNQEIKYKSKDTGKQVHEIVSHTKTDAGARNLIITKKAQETIEEIRKLNPDGEFLMMNPKTKKKMWATSYNDVIYDICKVLGIEKRSMHKCRKTYGTILLDSGADESLVMKQMGHSDIATTRKYYYYSNKGFDKQVAQIENAIDF